MVTVDGQKMGKSLNNFITLKQAFSGTHERLTREYEPLAVRQLILNSHYKSPLDFSDAALFAAQSGYEKITRAVIELRKKWKSAPEGEVDKEIEKRLSELKEKFEAAMNDDLNTSIALSVIFELVRLTKGLLEERGVTKETLDAVYDLFGRLGRDVLGIVKDEYPEVGEVTDERFNQLADLTIRLRDEVRKLKKFEIADASRSELHDLGIELQDKPEGTEWGITKMEPAGD
jgi:cysteinyl-tRNA synthetase